MAEKKNFVYLLAVMLITFFSITTANAQNNRPNIIYIYADDMGYGELGCYGQQKIRSPHLDQLAREGIRFTQHYTGAPVCAPARCMLLTGKHSGHSYIRGNYELGGFEDHNERGQLPLPAGIFTLAKLMKDAGYTTGMIGKWGLGMHNNSGDPNKHGFDYYYGYLDQKQAHNFYPTHLWENGKWDTLNNPVIKVHQPIPRNSPDSAFNYYKGNDYSLTKMADKTIAFIDAHKKEPFFLYLPFTGPHVSLQAPDEAVKEYIGRFEEQPYYGENGYAPNKHPLSTYAAMITYMDKQVGRIMEFLKQNGLDENTLVMFSSDNGSTFNVGGVNAEYFNLTGGLRGRKRELYEGGIRIPFIARWPGKIPGGRTSSHVSAQFDVMATLADILNKNVPPTDGISLLPSLLGNDELQKKHKYIYFEFPESGGQVAIRMGRWKGVRSNMKRNADAKWEIFDLENDEKETTDVANLHPELVKQFDEILNKEHQPSHIPEWEFVTRSKLTAGEVFSDNMLLQRNMPIAIWGKGVPGRMVNVTFSKLVRKTTIKKDSTWIVSFQSQPANTQPQAIGIKSGNDSIGFKNILIGDVWICTGQSNMEWPMAKEKHWQAEKYQISNPNIRILNPAPAGRNVYGVPFTDSIARRLTADAFYNWRDWQRCDSNTIRSMSAVAYYFAKKINAETSVPIGIINLAIGGAPLETFINTGSLRQHPQFSRKVRGNWLTNEMLPKWTRERAIENIGNNKKVNGGETGPDHAYKPGFAFTAGIAKLKRFPVKGILVYQGESNAEEPDRVDEYKELFKLFIKNYRDTWQNPRLPVYWAQLSSIERPHWPEFRNNQRLILQETSNTGMAVTSDIGSKNDVHPTDKKNVGERLARWALSQVYQKDIVPSGPLPVSAIYENGQVVISFQYIANGLKPTGNNILKGFSIEGKNEIAAMIDGDRVVIPVKTRPAYIFYGWKPFSDGNLVNSENLPASTFKIEVK